MFNECHSLDQAIILSRQIVAAAEQGEWQQVAAIEKDRAALIERYFTRSTGSINRSKTTQLKQLNDEIVVLLETARDRTRMKQLEMQQGSRASRTYRDIALE